MNGMEAFGIMGLIGSIYIFYKFTKFVFKMKIRQKKELEKN